MHPEAFGTLGIARGELSGITFSIKDEPEDFVVEEIPAYEPSGEGEHLFVWLEKRGMAATAMKEALRGHLGLKDYEVGMAGLKDQAAVTRQWVSVPARTESRLSTLDTPGLKVLRAVRHRHKLRMGHLRGNRFTVRLRGAWSLGAEAKVEAIKARIEREGVPNFYGPQRFGTKGDTASIGAMIFAGEQRRVPRRWLSPNQKVFALSALQAKVFNLVLMQRLQEWGRSRVVAGDVMMKKNGALFVVEDPEIELGRFLARETVTTGPMFGVEAMAPGGEAAQFEAGVILGAGISAEAQLAWAKTLPGSRRALWAYPENLTITKDVEDFVVAFSLEAGAYATVVLAAFSGPSSLGLGPFNGPIC
jgi:tRNA pseudouridine13 synthase